VRHGGSAKAKAFEQACLPVEFEVRQRRAGGALQPAKIGPAKAQTTPVSAARDDPYPVSD
jgi:hypothetical protein